MCHEALFQWGCCGKEWVPELDHNFTRPLLALCDRVQLEFEYGDDDEEPVLRPSPVSTSYGEFQPEIGTGFKP